MTPRGAARLERVAAGLVVAAAAAQLAQLAVVVALRIGYRADLEWMEGGTLVGAWRLRHGLPLYVAPGVDYIPFLYTPLYPALVAALATLGLPLGYPLARAVSIAALAVAGRLLYGALRRDGVGRPEAWAALGLCAAGFPFAGAFYDLARVDSLFVAVVVGGVVLLRARGATAAGAALSGALLAIACFVKQTGSLFLAAGALALCAMRARLVPLYAACGGAVVAAGVLLCDRASDGWFLRYVYELHQRHDLYWERITSDVWVRFVRFLPLAGALALALAAGWRWRHRGGLVGGAVAYWGFFAAVGLGVSSVGFATQWAFDNAFVPGVIFLAAFVGVAAAALRSAALAQAAATGRPAGRWLAAALAAALALQLAARAWDPRPHVPDRAARAAAMRFLDLLARLPGELLVPYHPFAVAAVGRRPGYHQMGVNDVMRAGLGFPRSIREAIAAQRYATIVFDGRPGGPYATLPRAYKLARRLRPDESPPTLTGYRVRPRYLLVPRRAEPPAPGTTPLVDFEDGTFAGWRVEGTAFGPRPDGGPVGRQGPIGPFGGLYLANSFHGDDAAVGRLTSPELTIPRPTLELLVGGGRDPRTLRVELWVDGERVRSATGGQTDELRRERWDVSSLVGRRARLVLVDEARGGWGHLLFDDLVAR